MIADDPLVTLDTQGVVRYAKIAYHGREVRERVPLYTFKLPPEKMAWEFARILVRLRKRMKSWYDIDLPGGTKLAG